MAKQQTGPQRAVQDYVGQPGKYLKLTGTTTAASFTNTQRQDASGNEPRYAFVEVETNPIRYNHYSTDPPTNDTGTAKGFPLSAGNHWTLTSNQEIKSFQFCNQTSGSNAIVHVEFWY